MVKTENMDNVDQPNSIYHVEQISMYPLQSTVTNVPFGLLAGECGMHSGVCVDGAILITNYRLYLQSGKNHHHIPLGLIEVVESRELFYLHISCKDARSYRCTFENNEVCLDWCNRILRAVEPPPQLNQLFAFYHCIWSQEKNEEEANRRLEMQRKYSFDKEMFENEMTRLRFKDSSWRITLQNEKYELCSSYPPYILVPPGISEKQLAQSAKFRASRRFPATVWRHTGNGAVIARCSQPEVGWLGWKSAEDAELLRGILAACSNDSSQAIKNGKDDSNLSCSPESVNSDGFKQIKQEETPQDKKLLIIDARSYTTAVANRARGGGYEFCPDYYPTCEIQFMNLANIHTIRKSFHALRQLCASPSDISNWFSQLENTHWLSHMSGLIRSAVTLVTAVETDERPVLVHCSDGWDRTPQIVALGELLLDPYYRTLEGFRTLIEREWLAFGHKFADRCGSSGCEDQNERCPVFLQWLDCVHQLLWQFPCEFEFTQAYLVKLAQHIYSGLFGTFLCNTQQERLAAVKDKTFSVWDFLNSPCFRNHLYKPEFNTIDRKVLWPQYNIRELKLWSEVYVGSMEENFMREDGAGYHPCPHPECTHRLMNRTRSFGDLQIAGDLQSNQYRRSSDPNVNSDSNIADLESAIPQENNASTQGLPILNGHQNHTHLRQPDFYPSDLEDADNLTDDQIDDLEQANFVRPLSIKNSEVIVAQVHNLDEDNSKKVNFLDENVITCETETIKSVLNSLNNVSLNGVQETAQNGDTDHSNNDNSAGVPASDVVVREVEGGSEADSATVECSRDAGSAFLDVGGSIETSTDTLVSDCNFISSSPKEINGFEKIQSPVGNSEMTEGCAQIIKFNQGAHSHHYGRDQRTRYSSSPYSISSNGWDNTLHNLSQQKNLSYQYTLGEDGLIPLRCVIQERLEQIVDEQKRKVDLLEKELHVTRQNLIKQSCHRCNHIDSDRQDDNSSVVESVFSASEGQASAGESQRSDLSWVAVEEASLADCQTLWVPDHAVSRCTGCGTEFWLGRRRHHCRKCGKIFCADCSENSTPLPSEQLYNPVRVCTGCYSELRRDCGEIPNQCKHSNTQTTNTNPQIAASSN